MTENTRPLRDFMQSLPTGSPARLVGTDLTAIDVSALLQDGISSVSAGVGISVNPADPKNPIISVDSVVTGGAAAGATAVQPGDLAAVATTGSYNDLDDKPSIPPAQVNSDWNASSGVAQILNKPVIPPAQVNADWDATSGVAEIFNKPAFGDLAFEDSVTVSEISATGTPSTTTYLRGDGSWATPSAGVTSVGVNVPTGFSVSGSPVTSSGTIAITYSSGYQGYTTAEANKLSGVASGATANQSDAYLLNRANHTGAQAISTVTGLQTALDDKALQATTISAGTGLTGGGTLAANRSIALSSTSIASLALADTAVQPADLGDLAYIDFPASPSGNVLNDSGNWVPQGGGGGGGGQVNSIQPGTGISVNSSDPVNPIVSLNSGSQASIALANTAVQPADLGDSAGLNVGTTAGTVAAGNHTHPAATTTVPGFMSAADKVKLNGIAAGATANTGTVTSVALSLPTGLSVSGSPVTASGTFAVTWASGYQGYTSAEATKLSGLTIGSTVQAYSAKLAALAGQTWAADRYTYYTSASAVAIGTLTSFGRSLIDDADAAAARTTLGLVIGTDVQAFDADTVKSDTGANLTAGFTTTAVNDGTKSSGTYTPTPSGGNIRRAVNGGAHTLAAPTATGDYTMVIQYTNNGSAGAITLSGWSLVTGDAFTTVNGDDFLVYVTKVNGFTHANVVALQ